MLLTLILLTITGAHALSAADSGQKIEKAPTASRAEPLLVGIYYNNTLMDEGIIYLEENEYWIPFEPFLNRAGLNEENPQGTVASYSTNLGILSYDTTGLKEFEGEECISFKDLKAHFITAPSFNQELYAVMIDIGWRPGVKTKRAQEVPDIRAPAGTISSIGIEAHTDYDFKETANKTLLLESSGRALGGVWDITGTGDPEEKMIPAAYHWTSFNRNLAVRLGTGYSGSYSLIGSSYMTGVQFGWNNRSIIRQLDAQMGYSSDIFLGFEGSQLRTLEGSGPPASIAELRFDGEVVARQRVPLDGKFAFQNVRMDVDLRKTEVYIYERSINENPIKVIDFSQSVSSRSLPEGEILIRGGAGLTGNILDPESGAERSTEAFTNVLYGLGRRVTIESAFQENATTGSPDLLSGAVLSIGNNWNAALYGARSNSHYGADFRLDATYTTWDASYWGTLHEGGYGSDSAVKNQNHSFRWTVRPMRELTLQAIGRLQTQADTRQLSYLLPAAALSPSSWLRLTATPHDDRSYRYETNLRLGRNDRLRGIYDYDVLSVDYLHNVSKALNVRLYNDYAFNTGDTVTNLGVDWYPGRSSSDIIATVLSCSGGSYGISGSWSRNINTGLRLAMEYSFNMNNATNLTTQTSASVNGSTESRKSIALTLSWDLGWSNRGFIPINRNEVTLTRGALAGSIAIDNEAALSSSDINNIPIFLNGRRMQQRQIKGDFFLGRLQPGIYRVSVDQENLPIELVTEKKEITVEIKNGAVTGMKIPVFAEYGASGFVSGRNGEGLAEAMVSITGGNGAAAKAMTNQFGYYRIDGLRSGTYTAAVESVKGISTESTLKREFRIKNDYVFDIDLKAETP
ncbi:MAG: carboxypeptidase-like regulatory domain-containing protein [Chlorobium phaeovibrioides]|nr:carboxypeptidase-like regulatory domain-containing protein [Chlorobium phaeovibrioides]